MSIMKCELYRRPEMTVTSCRGDRGAVIGRVERGMLAWRATVRKFDRYGREEWHASESYYDRVKAEAWAQGTAQGLAARALGGVRRRRR